MIFHTVLHKSVESSTTARRAARRLDFPHESGRQYRAPVTDVGPRTLLKLEIWIVLGLSLGRSAFYSVVAIIAMLTAGSLKDQQATLNSSRSERPWLDLTYQFASIGFALVPVALVLYLLALRPGSPLRTLGLTRERPWRSLVEGLGLAALIGLPGLGFYLLGRELGLTAEIVASGLGEHWWTIPVLILAAVQNAVVEEVIAVGYLLRRLKELTWGVPSAILASSLLRGGYHLYQGIGPALGNVAMGLVFAWVYHRTGRLWPLIVAHGVIDIVAFVGYALFADTLGLL